MPPPPDMDSQDAEEPTPLHAVHLVAGHIASPEYALTHSVYMPVAVARRSAYLRARIPPRGNSDTITIELPEAQPAPLKLYAWWLAYGNAPLFLHDRHGPVAQPHQTLVWRECFDLIQAHILGSKFGDADFQRYIICQLNEWLTTEQDPDLELLDYLWEIEREEVSDDLLCFVMGKMFRVEESRASILTLWMKRLIWGRRMMDYIEGIGRGRREAKDGTEGVVEVPAENALVRRAKSRRDGPVPEPGDPEAVYEVAPASKLAQRDSAFLLSQNGPETEILDARGTNQRITENPISGPSTRTSQRRKRIPERRRRSNARQQIDPGSDHDNAYLQEGPDHLPPPPRIHPKALASITNTNLHAEMGRQRTVSQYKSPSPSLHPILREGLASTRTPSRPWKRISTRPADPPELRGGAHGIPPSATMPPVADENLRLLDFWTDPSDAPGPDFWANALDDLGPPRNSPHTALARECTPSPRTTLQPSLPTYTPTTKQIIQSFRLARTPTPRRRSTRSWSVASIWSIEKEKPGRGVERPGRSVISRKPVPQGGMEFLGRYADGEMLKRVVSLNSRPGGVTRVGRTEEKEVWGRSSPYRRPGTA